MAEATTVLDAIPREVVENIARNFRALEELRKVQALTQAKMIRACLDRINRTTTAWDDSAKRQRIAQEREAAKLYLLALATMLENAGGLDLKVEPPSL